MIELYNDKIMKIFKKPKNIGVLHKADAIGVYTDENSSESIKIYLKIEDNTIIDSSFKAFAGAVTIACCQIATEKIIGLTLEQAMDLDSTKILNELGNVPTNKIRSSVIAVEGVKSAVLDYYEALEKEEKKRLRNERKEKNLDETNESDLDAENEVDESEIAEIASQENIVADNEATENIGEEKSADENNVEEVGVEENAVEENIVADNEADENNVEEGEIQANNVEENVVEEDKLEEEEKQGDVKNNENLDDEAEEQNRENVEEKQEEVNIFNKYPNMFKK